GRYKGGRLFDVAFAAHDGPAFRYTKEKLHLVPGTDHVSVYIAKGTHAAYPHLCLEQNAFKRNDPAWTQGDFGRPGCRQNQTKKWHLPEARFDGTRSWGNNQDAVCARFHCLQAFPVNAKGAAVGWAAWRGQWGTQKPGILGSAPRSPGLQARFRRPWRTRCTTRTQFTLGGANGRLVRCPNRKRGM
ncbi:MAG: hypothetical protein ACRDL8_20140, partial [Solirubrobacteraceae bacterium]